VLPDGSEASLARGLNTPEKRTRFVRDVCLAAGGVAGVSAYLALALAARRRVKPSTPG
jgi:hypothetical protein